MQQPFKIYVDRLKGGTIEKIEETVPSDFLDIHEKELSFPQPVSISGEAYLSGDHLTICLKIQTTAQIPCSICNELTDIPIVLDYFYVAAPLTDIRGPVFNYGPELREAILLQVPAFIECHEGSCPDRELVNKYLKPF